MEIKVRKCSKCKQGLENKDFYPSSKYWCKACQKEKMKEGYSTAYWKKRWARGTDKERRKRTARENYIKLFKLFETTPCVDCGKIDILEAQFDHIKDKSCNVSLLVGNGTSWRRILQEIDKCEIVCSGCHDKRTHKRTNSYRWQYTQHGEIKEFKNE